MGQFQFHFIRKKNRRRKMHLFNAFDLFMSFLIIMDFRFWMSIQYQVFNTSTLQSRTADWLIIDQICRRKLHPKKPWELWHLRMMWWCSSFFSGISSNFQGCHWRTGCHIIEYWSGQGSKHFKKYFLWNAKMNRIWKQKLKWRQNIYLVSNKSAGLFFTELIKYIRDFMIMNEF